MRGQAAAQNATGEQHFQLLRGNFLNYNGLLVPSFDGSNQFLRFFDFRFLFRGIFDIFCCLKDMDIYTEGVLKKKNEESNRISVSTLQLELLKAAVKQIEIQQFQFGVLRIFLYAC
jgi:hypothetical protein